MNTLIGFLGKKIGLGWASIIVYALVAAIVASVAYQAYNWAYANGYSKATAGWLARDNEELRKSNALVSELTSEARRLEREHAVAINTISTEYENEKAKLKSDNEVLNRKLASGDVRLRVPVIATSVEGCAGGVSETRPSTSESYGGASAELLPAFSAAIKQLFDEADEVAVQVGKLQQITQADRKLCGVKLSLDTQPRVE